MNIKISLKRLLLTVLLNMTVIIVPGISQAYERGHYSDRNVHYYNQNHERHNYRYSNHEHHNYKYSDHGHHNKYKKHHKYNKHRGHGHNKHRNRNHNYDHYYSVSRYDFPSHTIASHRKGLLFYLFD